MRSPMRESLRGCGRRGSGVNFCHCLTGAQRGRRTALPPTREPGPNHGSKMHRRRWSCRILPAPRAGACQKSSGQEPGLRTRAPKGIAEATDPSNQTRGSILKGREHSTRLAHTSGTVTDLSSKSTTGVHVDRHSDQGQIGSREPQQAPTHERGFTGRRPVRSCGTAAPTHEP